MTVYSTDTFNRANSTTSLGSTDGAGTLDPLTWTQQAGTWGISSNQAYTSASTVRSIATVELGVADVDLSLTLATLASEGLCLRFSGTTDYWRVADDSTGTLQLIKRVAGSNTTVGSSAGNSSGDVIRVVAVGSDFTVYRNAVSVITATDSFNSTATKHGIYNSTTTAGRLDDWSASSLPSTPQELTATETQTATIAAILQFGKELTATETQTPTLTVVLSLGKELSVTQTQTPTLEFDLASARTLSVTQTQTPILTAVTAHSKVLTVTQTQTPVISKAPSNAPAPTVSTVTPISGTTAGGTSVVIAGTNFGGTTAVKFGTTNAASFNLASDEQLAAVSPAHSAGTVPVIVTTPAGSSG